MARDSKKHQIDVLVEDHGSIFLFRPLSDSARNWVGEHIGEDNSYQPYYPTVVVEHRFIGDIIRGAMADGLAVQ